MRRLVPREWRFPRDRDDYRDSFRIYDNCNGRYHYLCHVVTETGENVDDVLFGESFVAAEMLGGGGISARLYNVPIRKVVVKRNRCSSNDVVRQMTSLEQVIEFLPDCWEG